MKIRQKEVVVNPLKEASRQARQALAVLEQPATFYDPERDGVTFSLLTSFKNCRERTKNVLEGWTSNKTSMAITFGNMCHELLRRVYNDFRQGRFHGVPKPAYIEMQLDTLECIWKTEHPRADQEDLEDLELTMLILNSVMPMYFKHWRQDFEIKTWEKLESEFRIPVAVSQFVNRFGQQKPWPHGPYRTFKRGKMDGSYRAGEKRRVRLFETKTKSRINDDTTGNILPFEMQVNIYLGALLDLDKEYPSGALYNIIRRPGLRLKKNETLPQFAQRIVDDIQARPDWYFIRLQMGVSRGEIDAAKRDLEGVMADFLAWWRGDAPHYRNSDHCENKYGVCPFLKKCATGETTGLYRRARVFMELEEM